MRASVGIFMTSDRCTPPDVGSHKNTGSTLLSKGFDIDGMPEHIYQDAYALP